MKLMKKIAKESILLFVCYVFVSLFIEDLTEFLEVRQGSKGEQTEAIVFGKTGVKDLFGDLDYIATLQMMDQWRNPIKLDPGTFVQLTKEQFEAVEVYETIPVYKIGQSFYSDLDVKGSFSEFPIFLLVWSVYPLGYLLYVLLKIPAFNRWLDRQDKLFSIFSILATSIFLGGITIGLLYSYWTAIPVIKNVAERFALGEQVETVAKVGDTYYERRSTRYENRIYYLMLSFETKDGERIFVSKEVTGSVYDKQDGTLPIRYMRDNPYNVFISKTDALSVLQLAFNSRMMIYYVTIVLTWLVGLTFIMMRRKRRTGSYYKNERPLKPKYQKQQSEKQHPKLNAKSKSHKQNSANKRNAKRHKKR
ncbi:hypothetical protein [Sporosarcina sp. Te-1]|uniref:hypothetical protein n=1 Tax=Sporosarcina sp. Te-1 TaxID=2818390 RepID=UPI001A9E2FFC|nr:hypothetical protein [Sporosarcina sp. Te-1]QTD39640.1 hypothetical protein J3U78_12345 [Sporosarcina sp. Te-1]